MKKRIALLTAILLLVMMFCACGAPSPTKTVDTFLTAIKDQNSETIASVYENGSFDLLENSNDGTNGFIEDEFSEELQNAIMEKVLSFDYELFDEKINGDTATVKVTMSTYNLGAAMDEFMEQYITQALQMAFSGASDEDIEELANTLFAEQIEKAEKYYSGTAVIDLTKDDDGWKVDGLDDTGEFMNILLGGLIDSLDNISESLN